MYPFRDKVLQLYSKYDHQASELASLELVMDGVRSKIDNLVIEREDNTKAWETLRVLLEQFSDESIRLLEEMLNKGVQVIFNDRLYSIKIEVTDTKRKLTKLWLIEDIGGQKIKSRIPSAVGGGIQVVVSFIFQVFLIRIYSQRPFLIIDEAFSQVSSQYMGNFMEFLRYLITDMNFVFLFITHDQRVVPYFDKIYEVNMGNVLKITREEAELRMASYDDVVGGEKDSSLP